MNRPVPVLEYSDGRYQSELAIEVRSDGGVVITVPTRRSAGKLAWEIATADFWVVLLLPLIYPAAWLLFRLFGSRAPRAILWLGKDELILTETSDEGFGWRPTVRSWPRDRIVELRPNRYQTGLWLHVAGEVQCDLLQDLPDEWIYEIGKALGEAMNRLNADRRDP